MPRAPTFIAPRFRGSGSATRPTFRGGDIAQAQGIVSLGSALTDVAINLSRKQTAVRANKKLSKFKESAAERSIQARQEAGPGAEGFTPKFMEGFDASAQDLLESSENNNEREILEASLDRLRSFTFANALEFEATSGVVQRKLDLQNSIDLTANSIRSNPGQFGDSLEEMLSTLDAIRDDLTPVDEGQIKEAIEQKLAVAAVQGEIDIAPGLALAELKSGKWDRFLTPEQKNTLLRQAKSSANTVDKVARALLARDIENHIASIRATGTGISGVNRDRINQVFPDPQDQEVQALNLERSEKLASSIYEIGSTITTGTAQERRDVVDDLVDKVNAGGRDSADNQRLLEFAAASFTQFVKALENDPAGIALEHNVAVQAAVDRGTVPGIRASIEAQVDYGVPRDSARILTRAQVSTLVKDLSTGNTSDDLIKIDQLRTEWTPEFFGRGMSELVDGGLDPLIPILDSVALNDPAVGVRALQVLRLPLADIKSQFNSSTTIPFSELELAVQDITTPMLSAIAGNAVERLGYVSRYQQLITRVAAANAVQDGFDDVNKSAEDAYNQLFGDHYLLEETHYIPVRDEEGLSYDADIIVDWTRKSLRSIEEIGNLDIDPTVIDLSDGIPRSTSHKVTDFLVSKNGAWINTPDGKGLQLILQTDVGPQPARQRGTGEFIIRSFREIEAIGQEQRAEKVRERRGRTREVILEEIRRGVEILERRRREARETIERVAGEQ